MNIQKRLSFKNLNDSLSFKDQEINTSRSAKNYLLEVLFFSFSLAVFAQPDSLFIKEKTIKIQGPEWTQQSKASIDLSEVTFVNWNAGGSNSISALLGYSYNANYKDKYFFWKNSVSARYGLNKQQKQELRKTDDLFEITSNLGYKPEGCVKFFRNSGLGFG